LQTILIWSTRTEHFNMKVAINRCYGGFGLSEAAVDALLIRKGIAFVKTPSKYESLCGPDYYTPGHVNEDEHYISTYSLHDNRADPDLIAVIEQLGKKANGSCADLKIVEIPDDVEWEISEYDGNEHVAECHRTWA